MFWNENIINLFIFEVLLKYFYFSMNICMQLCDKIQNDIENVCRYFKIKSFLKRYLHLFMYICMMKNVANLTDIKVEIEYFGNANNLEG